MVPTNLERKMVVYSIVLIRFLVKFLIMDVGACRGLRTERKNCER